jgi:ATP synthase protein I
LYLVSSVVSTLGSDLAAKARRIIFIQLLVTTVVAAGFFAVRLYANAAVNDSAWAAMSVFYGGTASVLLALISIRGFKRANELALSDPHKSMMILYIGAVVRFAAVIIVLGIGLGVIKLEPMAVFVGFALAQTSYLMGVRDRKAARSPD